MNKEGGPANVGPALFLCASLGLMDSSTPHTLKPNASMQHTISAMVQLARQGSRDLDVRGAVEAICQGIAQGDYASEVLALYYWVCRHIRYMRDPNGTELLKTPKQLLATRAGDCDDMATLLAAMLLATGNTVNFAIAGFGHAEGYSHVYVEVATPHGKIVVDPVANRATEKMLRDMRHYKSIPISRAGAMDAGVGGRVLGGSDALRHIGPGGGNVYSVYDYDQGTYRYFEGPAAPIPATGQFRKPKGSLARGAAAPEAFAVTLPAGARAVGTGPVPRGLLAGATSSSDAGLGIGGRDVVAFALGAATAWFMAKRGR